MGEEPKERQERLVSLSRQAEDDIRWVYNSTADTWGFDQADKYLSFLRQTMILLSSNPHAGREIDGNSARIYLAKISKKRMSHGHRIIYREVEDGIEILRVLHTAMDWPDDPG